MNIKLIYIITFLLAAVMGCSSLDTAHYSDDGTNRNDDIINQIIYDDGTTRHASVQKKPYKKEPVNSTAVSSKPKSAAPSKTKTEKKVVSVKKETAPQPKPKVIVKESPQKSTSSGVTAVEKTEPKITKTEPRTPAPAAKAGRFYYPTENSSIIKEFSLAGDSKNPGIDFSVNGRTAIKASAPGWVIYSGKKSGIDGNLVIVFHNEKYLTIFSNLDSIAVKKGDHISSIDTTIGYASSYYHFEMRQQTDSGIKVLDPKSYLVKR